MKKIEAIIRPSKLRNVQEGLRSIDIPCLTVISASGSGLQKSYTKIYRGTKDSLALQNRIMIICVVSDKNLERCVDIILDCGSNGEVGDGKIFIVNLESAVRIRTGETGSEAL